MSGLDDMPKIHERTIKVDQAEAELGLMISKWIEKHQLTYGETLRALGSQVTNWAKYLIRTERHPTEPGKKGDER